MAQISLRGALPALITPFDAQGEVDVYCMLTDSVYSSSRKASVTDTKNV